MPAPWIQRVMFHLRTLFDRRAVEREIDDELRFHLEMEASARQRAGLDAAAAKRQAARLFGGVESTKDDLRDARGGNGVENVGGAVAAGAIVELAIADAGNVEDASTDRDGGDGDAAICRNCGTA